MIEGLLQLDLGINNVLHMNRHLLINLGPT